MPGTHRTARPTSAPASRTRCSGTPPSTSPWSHHSDAVRHSTAARVEHKLDGSRTTEEGEALTGLPAIPVVLSTSSVYPERTTDAFEAAARLGYDGLEVMVYTDPVSQSGDALARPGRLPPGPGARGARARPAAHPARLGPRAVVEAAAGQGPGRAGGREGGRGAPAVPLAARLRARVRGGHRRRCQKRPTSSSRWRTCSRSGQAPPRCPGTRRTGTRPSSTCRTSPWTCRTPPPPLPTRSRWRTTLGPRLAHIHLADGTGVIERSRARRAPGARARQAALCRAAARHRRHGLPGDGGRRGEHPARGDQGRPAARTWPRRWPSPGPTWPRSRLPEAWHSETRHANRECGADHRARPAFLCIPS